MKQECFHGMFRRSSSFILRPPWTYEFLYGRVILSYSKYKDILSLGSNTSKALYCAVLTNWETCFWSCSRGSLRLDQTPHQPESLENGVFLAQEQVTVGLLRVTQDTDSDTHLIPHSFDFWTWLCSKIGRDSGSWRTFGWRKFDLTKLFL